MQLHTVISLSETINIVESVEKFTTKSGKFTAHGRASTSNQSMFNQSKDEDEFEELEQPSNVGEHLNCVIHRLYLTPKSENFHRDIICSRLGAP